MTDDELAIEVLRTIRRWRHSEATCASPAAREVCRATMHNLINLVFDHDESGVVAAEGEAKE